MELRDPEKQEWVRIDPKIRDRISRLLVELAESIEKGRTRRGTVRSLTKALEPHLPLREFEMGWKAKEEQFSFIRLVLVEEEWKLTSGVLENEFAAAVLDGIREKKVLVSLRSSEGRKQVILPFYENEKCPGYARFDWQKEDTAEGDLSYAMFEPLRRLLMLVQRKLSVLERVSRLSQKAHRKIKQIRQDAHLHENSSSMIAVSVGMRSLMEQAQRVARYDSTVLIRGESGAGKERLAHYIHQISRRSRKPFIHINCGALPEGLIESELFGHEKGAFVGANHQHIGCFERADGGTLLLDEIAELPFSMQVKLLHFLQDGELMRVGGEERIKLNVRVMAATRQNLEKLVKKKGFREDLLFRLNVFPLVLPPLRKRREDLPILVQDIVTRLSKKMNCSMPRILAMDLVTLSAHKWPGNIRELENVLERTLILSADGGPSFSEAVSLALSLEQRAATLAFAFPPTKNVAKVGIENWKTASRRCIENALRATNGRIFGKDGAAELLDLRPTTLQSKMKKLGIERKKFTPK